MEIRGYQLDDYRVLSKLIDKDGVVSWWLFTFQNPIKDGVVKCGMNPHTKEMWCMEQIDPNDFDWGGKRVMLVEDKS